MLNSIKSLIKKVIFHFIKPPVVLVRSSYSQAGEDAIIKFLFAGRKIAKPIYLELGVFLPDSHNNTYLFYKNGSRGVLVEADITLIEEIRKVRPEDKVLGIGVGTHDMQEANFYIFEDPALNTFNDDEASLRQRSGLQKLVNVAKVPIKSINSIIESNFETYPHYLSIDIEGLDFEVLKSLNLEKYPIPVICAETCAYSENHIKPKNSDIIDFMLSKDYFVYGDTYINTIFVNKNWFYSENR